MVKPALSIHRSKVPRTVRRITDTCATTNGIKAQNHRHINESDTHVPMEAVEHFIPF